MSKGFQYYKLDTDRYEDIRIRKLRRAYGTKGLAVYDFLLARIYGIEGCYTIFDDDCIFSVSEYFDMNESSVKEIIIYCASVGLFDKGLLTREGVITSTAIQRRFAEMCKATKRMYISVPEEYLLLSAEELGLTIKMSKNSRVFRKAPEDFEKLQSFLKNSGGNAEDGDFENSGENEKTLEEMPKTPEDFEKLRSAKKEKKQKKNKVIKNVSSIEPSTKAEDSMSLTPDGVTDASSSSGSSLLFDIPEIVKESDVDYDELIEFWNTVTKGSFGRLKNIENKRRQMTRARIRENGKEAFLQAIRNAAASEFLHTVTWFDYDWMICPNNFVKVLEDKYGKKERTDSAGSGGLGPAGLASANSIPMGGGEARVETTYRKRVYD